MERVNSVKWKWPLSSERRSALLRQWPLVLHSVTYTWIGIWSEQTHSATVDSQRRQQKSLGRKEIKKWIWIWKWVWAPLWLASASSSCGRQLQTASFMSALSFARVRRVRSKLAIVHIGTLQLAFAFSTIYHKQEVMAVVVTGERQETLHCIITVNDDTMTRDQTNRFASSNATPLSSALLVAFAFSLSSNELNSSTVLSLGDKVHYDHF